MLFRIFRLFSHQCSENALFGFNQNKRSMENDVKQRVREVIDANAESTYAFSKEIRVKQTTVSDYLNNGKTPSWAVIRGIIEEYSDISLEWLLRGKGPMYISDIPTDDDTDQVLDLKAEITRLRAERDELRKGVEELRKGVEPLRQEVIELRAINRYQEKRLDKLAGLLREEPQLSIAAEKRTDYITNPIIK